MVVRGVQDLSELPRSLSGVGEVGGGLVEDPAGTGAVVQLADHLGCVGGQVGVDGARAPVIRWLLRRGCGQVSGVTPGPATTWDRRTDSPQIRQTCAWGSSRSTVAVARAYRAVS